MSFKKKKSYLFYARNWLIPFVQKIIIIIINQTNKLLIWQKYTRKQNKRKKKTHLKKFVLLFLSFKDKGNRTK